MPRQPITTFNTSTNLQNCGLAEFNYLKYFKYEIITYLGITLAYFFGSLFDYHCTQ